MTERVNALRPRKRPAKKRFNLAGCSREYRRKSQYTEDREFICEKYEECKELDERIKHILLIMESHQRERDSEDAVIRRLEIESWQYDMEAAERRGLRALGK